MLRVDVLLSPLLKEKKKTGHMGYGRSKLLALTVDEGTRRSGEVLSTSRREIPLALIAKDSKKVPSAQSLGLNANFGP